MKSKSDVLTCKIGTGKTAAAFCKSCSKAAEAKRKCWVGLFRVNQKNIRFIHLLGISYFDTN